MYSSELFSAELLREKFENDLEILGENSASLVTQKCGNTVSGLRLHNSTNFTETS